MSHDRLHDLRLDDPLSGLLAKSDRFGAAPAAPPADWRSEIWLPEPFEPRYHYPLLVWLHDAGESELATAEWAEATGMQNLLVVGVRGPLSLRRGGGHDWPADGAAVWAAVAEELAGLPPELRFDASRVTLAGRGSGARAALAAWRSHPQSVCGACLVDPGFAADAAPLTPGGTPVSGGRLWVGGFGATSWRDAGRAAYALGTDVRIEPASSAPDRVGPALNDWVMRSVPTAVLA